MTPGFEFLLAATGTGADVNRGAVAAIAIAGLAVLLLWHQWHKHRYPERLKCTHCKGSGKITSRNLVGRTVRGTCPRCGGDSWGDRGAL